MIQQALNFNPVRRIPRIIHRSYGGKTPSHWRDTSIQAAETIEPFAPNQRDRVLMELTRRPGANHEVAARTGIQESSVCARVAEIREDGLVQDSGRRTLTMADCKAVVWEVTEAGRETGLGMIRAGREFS